ncbi:hypothetical protein IJH72_01660 [Candidatus Saccharibacteria bacterium]|nr:hypothetical protein [Candidatus Saccharibacteria bacterium]
MKKIPILLSIFSIFMGNLTIAPLNVSAKYREDETTWYTVDELLEFSEEVRTEEELLCGDNQDCRMELHFSHFEEGAEHEKYRALYMLEESQFWVTSINPGQETISVLYFDEEPFLKMMGIEEHHPLDFIFLAWFDEINGAIGNYNHELPIEPQFPEDLHLLYADESLSYSSEGFPSSEQFNLPIAPTNLRDNHLGYIYLAVFGEYFNSKGYVDYSSCLTEPDYGDGVECRLMFSADRGYRYFPPRETIDEPETIEPTEKPENPTEPTSPINPENPTDLTESKPLTDPEGPSNVTENPINENLLDEAMTETHQELKTSDDREENRTKYLTVTEKTSSTPGVVAYSVSSTNPVNPTDSTISRANESTKESVTSVNPLGEKEVSLPEAGELNPKCEQIVIFPWWIILLLIIGDAIILWFFWPKNSKRA